jgi:hypothetical protein
MRWRSPGPVRHPPGFIEPCLPTLARTVPTGAKWVYEIKHDGFRLCAGVRAPVGIYPLAISGGIAPGMMLTLSSSPALTTRRNGGGSNQASPRRDPRARTCRI